MSLDWITFWLSKTNDSCAQVYVRYDLILHFPPGKFFLRNPPRTFLKNANEGKDHWKLCIFLIVAKVRQTG